jgi:hypothetical protein
MGAVLRFVLGFIIGLIGTIMLLDSVSNNFIAGFILALFIAVLASRGD